MQISTGMSQSKMEGVEPRRNSQAYLPGSIWNHIFYGVGSMVAMSIPFLIPGLTFKDWVMGFFGFVVVLYIILCLLGMWKSLMRDGRSQGRSRR